MMKRVLVISDSYKGTMSSAVAGDIIARAVLACGMDAAVYPVADGGEGTVDAYLSAFGGESEVVQAVDPYFNDCNAIVGIIGDTAVIEMASCAGIGFRAPVHDIENTTTYGVGMLIEAALDFGVSKIILGLGGSLTNDGGCGAAAALGVRFFDREGQPFIPVSGNLQDISSVDVSRLDKRLSSGRVKLTAICDVDVSLTGETGAARMFSPQKGATPEQVERLENGLLHLASTVKSDLSRDADAKGDGAAGGLGFGARVFLGAEMRMGIETLLDELRFEEIIKEYDYIVTGEGKLDAQSTKGKVVSGIAKRASGSGVPVVVIAGEVEGDMAEFYKSGIAAAFSTNRYSLPFDKARLRCEDDLYETAHNIFRLLNSGTGK